MSEKYYVHYLCASFQQGIKLPAKLQPYLNHFDLLTLEGEQLTAQLVGLLLGLVRQGHLHNIYLTPFQPAGELDDLNRHRLVDAWHNWFYPQGCGCGAALLDRERACAFFKRLDEYILGRPLRRRADWEAPAQPPLVFADNEAMAQALANFIRTGTFDGSRSQPAAPDEKRRGVDPNLLFWIQNMQGKLLHNPADLAEVKFLNLQYYISGVYPEWPDWLAPEPGNWQLLADLPQLESLFLPELKLDDFSFLAQCQNLRQLGLSRTNFAAGQLLAGLKQLQMLELSPQEFGDFSFLAELSELEILDLSRTDFRDCRLLTGLPNLRLVHLPAERQLLHREALFGLPLQVKTYPERSRGADVPEFEIIEPQPVGNTIDIAPPYQVLHIDADGFECQAPDIDVRCLQKLLNKVSEGRFECVTASPEYWGEEDFMELDCADGWATLGWEDWDNDCWYTIYNPAEAGNLEDAPPEIGGQTPVPKMHAIQDLQLAADCLAWFIKYGGLYPGAYWAKYYK